jgi:hypothetical protein
MTNPASGYNSALVRVQRKAGVNGTVPLFFGHFLGVESPGMEASARALYPEGTGSAGNRGTVDIGHGLNSTADLQRQVLHGINANDLALHGGSLELNAQGQLLLNGDTGISAAIKDELTQIRGQPRVIPLFDSVSGNGNNGNYTVVGFAGVRIVNVRLTGPMRSKEVVIQPAPLMIRGGIPTGGPPTTRFVYSPVVLVE